MFVWLKVAMINIAYSTMHDSPPFPMEPILFVMEQYEISLNRKGLLYKKTTFKILNKNDIDIFINDTWQKYAGDYSKLQGDWNFAQPESNVNLHKGTSSSCSMSPELLTSHDKLASKC